MHLLFETSAGYALFKVLKPKAIESENLWQDFKTIESASAIVKLKAFSPFTNTTEAVVAATSIIDSKLDKSLKKFLKKNIISKDLSSEELAVHDIKLGGLIKEKLDIQCIHNDHLNELYRGIRCQMENLLSGAEEGAMKAMQLGLSHSLSRYKLKFSADKVDIMIVQAIGLLDDLDKEVNMYAMRVREWFGWHFPEMAKIVNDNMFYAKIVLRMGMRINCKKCDFSDILGDENMEMTLKKVAETSMGTEISEADLMNIQSLCSQVVSLSEYRIQLYEYLRNRMAAIAPNLTVMVGELVGARLVAHAGSILNLAKQPASTIQILGAEKALFRALKTKHDTPKYGLIFHASLIGQAAPKNKGKISRLLAAKTALAIRVDALGDTTEATIAIDNRIKVENRIRQLEGGQKVAVGGAKVSTGPSKYDGAAARALAPPQYNAGMDMVVVSSEKKKKEKRKVEEEDEEEVVEEEPKAKKVKKAAVEEEETRYGAEEEGEKKKKKSKKHAKED